MVQSWQHLFELLLFFLSLDKLHFPIPSAIKILPASEWIIFPPLVFFYQLGTEAKSNIENGITLARSIFLLYMKMTRIK